MDKMSIVGGATLNGEVKASGAKNSALPLIFSTLLAEGTHVLNNVPQLRDIGSSNQLMDSLGCETHFENNKLTIKVKEKLETLAHYDQVRKMRASILVLGPLLARFGEAKVSLPGGCAIGARPIGFHLDALEQMGAKIEVKGGYVNAACKRLQGAVIEFPFASVGGTENIMMAASLAQGTTVIKNAAREPEIGDLAEYLNAMGAKVSGHGSSEITIEGVDKLSATEHTVIADRIEVGTLLVAGAITGGKVKVLGARADHLGSFLEALEKVGCKIQSDDNSISIERTGEIKPAHIDTEPYPGYPTDLQAQMMALMTQAQGESSMTENVFENRFMHVSELARLGAKIKTDSKKAVITGPSALAGAPVMATDLRASACLILAGLVAEGETIVNRIYHLDRGYEKLEDKIQALGGNVKRIK
ncbi:MAG: UDP-N-acetylglucosamine 1-carboxyvinyltransferase [Bdellovibrionales bacterium]|nr:UDP-N-acetylglucosamine 1-carboxyvinyltransferase [Bdellovibrionales bacterium]NQZ18655.1 UDP-N-acetylglucosamine 1-carboxyvinyltransferase [Bdellovibrionales bacterium]